MSFGSTIPLFTFAYDPVVPIDLPGPALPDAVRERAKWRNSYDPDDVLGYSLKPLSAEYNKAVHEDVEINVGGFLEAWNPASHNAYWTDRSFTDPVADHLMEVLDAKRR